MRPTHRSLSFRPIRRTLPRIWTALRSCPSQLRLVPQALLPLMRSVQSQADALMEVAAGTSDACVIDLLMAGAMIGEGTSYPNLVYTLDLNEANGDEPENYVVGFRKDSDLTAAFNDFYKSAYEDGTVEKLAEKYGVQEAIVAP